MRCRTWPLCFALLSLSACSSSTVPADFGQPCSAEDAERAERFRQVFVAGGERWVRGSDCESGWCYAATRFSQEECLALVESGETSEYECEHTRILGGPNNHCTVSCADSPCPAGYICDEMERYCRRTIWDQRQCTIIDEIGPGFGCNLPDGTMRMTTNPDAGMPDAL